MASDALDKFVLRSTVKSESIVAKRTGGVETETVRYDWAP